LLNIASQFPLKHPDPRLPIKAGTMRRQLASFILPGDDQDKHFMAARRGATGTLVHRWGVLANLG